LDKGLKLDCTIDNGTPEHLQGDSTALKQIMVNLLSNAIKFTTTGSVTMVVEPIERDSQEKELGKVLLKFSVTDTGIGIPLGEQRTIFERFIQADGSTSRKYGGSGLGLAISRSLAKLMAGDLIVSSTEGSGSTFSFTAQFPIALQPPSDKAIKDPTAHIKQTTSDKRRILLVEDDERNRLLFSMFLKDIHHTLDTAVDGEMALTKHFATPYDLILMDIEMPGMDGFETTKAIRDHENEQQLESTPIIAVTAHAIKEAETRCRQSGCTDYLAKPVTKARLREMVGDYLGVCLDPNPTD